MRSLNKHSHWWKKEEKDWVMQGRDGNWYIYRNDKTPTVKISKKRTAQQSLKFTAGQNIIIGLAAAFGVSLAALIVVLIS